MTGYELDMTWYDSFLFPLQVDIEIACFIVRLSFLSYMYTIIYNHEHMYITSTDLDVLQLSTNTKHIHKCIDYRRNVQNRFITY